MKNIEQPAKDEVDEFELIAQHLTTQRTTIPVRVSLLLKGRWRRAAFAEGKSLNQWIIDRVESKA